MCRASSIVLLVALAAVGNPVSSSAQLIPELDPAEYRPLKGDPADIEGFWIGSMIRDGSMTPLAYHIYRDEEGALRAYRPQGATADFSHYDYAAPRFHREVIYEEGVLSIRVSYALDATLYHDMDRGELIGMVTETATPIMVHLKRGLRPVQPYRTEPIEFASGEVHIVGELILPLRPGPHPLIIWTPGRGKSLKDQPPRRGKAKLLAARGVAGFVYDKRGCGQSTGDHKTATLADHAEDVINAAALLAQHPQIDEKQIGLHGTSAGGWTNQIASASMQPPPAFMISSVGPAESVAQQQRHVAVAYMTWNGYSEEQILAAVDYVDLVAGDQSTQEVVDQLLAFQADARRDGWDAIFADEPASLEDLETDWSRINRYDPSADLRRITCPYLAIFGAEDYVVPPQFNVPKLKQAFAESGNDDLTIIVLQGVGHGLDSSPEFRTFGDAFPRSYWRWGRVAPGFMESVIEWTLDHVTLSYAPIEG